MRDAEPLDPETVAALDAIDATLHGDPVDPELAELAELSLILRDERPRPDPAFLARLDGRVADRFAAAPRPARRPGPAWWAAGTALAGIAAIVLLVVLGSAVPSRHVSASSGAAGTATVSSSASASAAAGSSARAPSGPAPTPRGARGRDIAQSARLTLRAQAGRVDAVAQQLFDVVGDERGDVESSHVTELAGGAGSARFSLEVPSGHLQATLDRLSSLRGASVVSRADASADITGDVNATAARLATARALRRSLLRRLAAADTASEASALQAALARDESSIVADSDALARLRATVSDSAIAVTVSAPPAAPHGHRRAHAAGGFTLHRALHDAGRILVVAAGVVLIALAVLVPLGLLVALASWVWARTLRRRREGALGP